MPQVHTIDIILILIYFAFVISKAFWFMKRNADSADYFLAGRSLGWVAVGFSLFASNISSTTLVGLSGAAYATGISISNYEWMASVVLVFFAVFFIPYYIRSKVFTMPEFLERRFNSTCRYYFSALTILGNIFIDTAGTLYAGSLVVRLFFPGTDIITAAAILALCSGVYAAVGGLAAVVATDVLQAIVLLIGSVILTLYALSAAGSWAEVVAATPPEMLSVIRPIGDPVMPWTGMIIGVPILGFYFWCTNQFVVQRVLGARDITNARRGALFAALLKLPVLFIMVLPGIMARLIYPELDKPDIVFPTMVADLLPIGVRGIVLAALLAAIMSSVDSTLNSASTLVTMDFVKKLRPSVSEQQLAMTGRGTCILFMLIAVAWIPVVAESTTLFGYLQSALAYLFPPVVAVFILGLFWKRASSAGALAGMVGGHAVSLTVFFLEHIAGWEIGVHFLEMAGVYLAVSAALIIVVSLKSAPPSAEQVAQFTWSRDAAESDLPPDKWKWYLDYRVQSAALLLLTALLVWCYR